MRQTALSDLLTMLKAELGVTLSSGVATADDTRYKKLLSHTQTALAGEAEWPFLRYYADVSVSPGTQTITLPTTLDWDQPAAGYVKYSNEWSRIGVGASPLLYNVEDSESSEARDPIVLWCPTSHTEAEVWPVPQTTQTLRFVGRKALGALTSDTDKAELDDLLIILWTAAQEAARTNDPGAPALLARAQARLARLKGNAPYSRTRFVLGGGGVPFAQRYIIAGEIEVGGLTGSSGIIYGSSGPIYGSSDTW